MSDHEPATRSHDEVIAVTRRALSVPLLELLGARLVDEADPRAGLSMTAGPSALNAVGTLHAGASTTLLELAAYLALLPDLAADEDAATHAFSASYLRAGRSGDDLRCAATVLQRSRRLAFVSAELSREGEVIATATVTKSILRPTATHG